MASHRENFESWFVKVLESLYPCRDAGFVIVMTAFPLLERYLREKVGLSPNGSTDDRFHNALCGIFTELEITDRAKEFWQVYRHGLLHEATFSGTNRKGDSLYAGWLSHDGPIVSVDKSDGGRFLVNPVAFAQRVLQTIMDDFETFEGAESSRLPVVKPYPDAPWNLATTAPSRGIIPPVPLVLGTSAEKKP